MAAEVFGIDGTPLNGELLAATAAEEMALMFEEMAQEARAGGIENFVCVLMRSPVKYSMRSWRQDTLRMIGALEAAKVDLTMADSEMEDIILG